MKPRSILIIQTAFLGDVILATALVEKLKTFFPDSALDFLVRKGNESVLEGHPFLRQVLVFDKTNKYRNLFRLIRKIRVSRYDLVINIQRFATSGILTALSGAKETAGFEKNPLAAFFSRKFPHDLDGSHEVERNQKLISWLTDSIPSKPKLYPKPSDYSKTEAFTSEPFITISPASVWFTKQWPAEKWIGLIEMAVPKFRVFILGAPSDTNLGDQIAATFQPGQVVNLAGRLSLLRSAALMEKAAMNFVNDSAPMHLASAMNAPVTAIYCSTVPRFGFGPLSDQSRVVEVLDLPCRPCGLHGHKGCPLGHFKCAFDLQVASVWNQDLG